MCLLVTDFKDDESLPKQATRKEVFNFIVTEIKTISICCQKRHEDTITDDSTNGLLTPLLAKV